ncbi:hypothetical protein Tco_0327201 [Tanacetum coccineum]
MLDRPRIYWFMGKLWRSGITNCVCTSHQSSALIAMTFTLKIWPRVWDIRQCHMKNLGFSDMVPLQRGLKIARENLQSRVKEEDSITDVENAVFDLGVMDSLCFLFVDQK